MEIALKFFVFSTMYFFMWEAEGSIAESFGNHIVRKCTKCPPGWGVVKRCTKHTDTECALCIRGLTYSSHHSNKSPCWTCSKCGVGLYESHKCTPVRDTICSECISYLDHKNITKTNDFLEKCTYMFLNSKKKF